MQASPRRFAKEKSSRAGFIPASVRIFLDGSEVGQALIEFAVLITVLLIVMLGTVDLARMMYYQEAVNSAARMGAEMAMNRCPNSLACGKALSTTTYDFVLQAATCDATDLHLQPSVNCTPTSGTSPCPTSSTCPPACSQDVCINPAYSPTTTTTLTSPTDITVTVGYLFDPISPLMKPFLESNANPAWKNGCWTGDPPHTHTLCYSVVVRATTG